MRRHAGTECGQPDGRNGPGAGRRRLGRRRRTTARLARRRPAKITVSDSDGQARYAVAYKGRPLLAPSPLGLVLATGGSAVPRPEDHRRRQAASDTTYDLVAGKARTVRDHYNQLSVDFQEPEGQKRQLRVIVRAYDDGVAFRYVLPRKPARRRSMSATRRPASTSRPTTAAGA
jgi:hypothetical protein